MPQSIVRPSPTGNTSPSPVRAKERNARRFVRELARATCFSDAYCLWHRDEGLQGLLDLTRRQLTYRLKNAEDFGLILRFENGAAFRRWYEMEGVPGYGLDPKGPKNMNGLYPKRVIVIVDRLGERVRPEGLYGPRGLDSTHKNARVTNLSPETDAPEGVGVTNLSPGGSQICDPPGHENVTRPPIGSLNLNLEGKETFNVVGSGPSGMGEEPAVVRRMEAAKLVQDLRVFYGWKLGLEGDGRIRPGRVAGFAGHAPVEVVRELVEPYRAEILDLLRAAHVEPRATPAAAPAPGDVPAPKVHRAVQGRLHGLRARVIGGDEAAVPEMAAALCEAFLDEDRDASMKFYLGLLGEVCAGTKPGDWLTTPLEEAMRPNKRRRGAVFTSCVKRLSGEGRRKREGSRAASPPHA